MIIFIEQNNRIHEWVCVQNWIEFKKILIERYEILKGMPFPLRQDKNEQMDFTGDVSHQLRLRLRPWHYGEKRRKSKRRSCDIIDYLS